MVASSITSRHDMAQYARTRLSGAKNKNIINGIQNIVLTSQMRMIIINLSLLYLGLIMSSQLIISQAKLVGNEECKVLYNKDKDMVELEIGDTSLRFEARNFFMMNEMLRKAAARLVMQTELHHA
jgi:hypothetical protein